MNRCSRWTKVLIPVFLFLSCAHDSPGPCPEDGKLLERFFFFFSWFQALKDDPGNKALLEELGLRAAHVRSRNPLRIRFAAWYKDFFGAGGVAKGYAYCEEAPGNLVEEIDRHADPGSPEVKRLHRHIAGPWYLYYESDN